VSLRERIIEFDGFPRGGVGEKIAFVRGEANTVAGANIVGVREAGVRQGIVGIRRDGLLIEFDTFLEALGSAALP
jgi:hypothetical protein